MDATYQKLATRIETLTRQQQAIETTYTQALGKLVMATVKDNVDIATLAGLIQDARNVIAGLPHRQEDWQAAGRRFLSQAKHTRTLANMSAAASANRQNTAKDMPAPGTAAV
jgi:hypothetical protein